MKHTLKNLLYFIIKNQKNEKKLILLNFTKLKIQYLSLLWKIGLIYGYKFISTRLISIFLSPFLKTRSFHFNVNISNIFNINYKRLFALNLWNPNYFILISSKLGLTFYWKSLEIGGTLLT